LKSLNKQLKISQSDLDYYTDNYNKASVSNNDETLANKYAGINKMTSRLTKIIQNVNQMEKENAEISKNVEIKRLESHNNVLKSQNEQLKRITQSLQELSKNKSNNDSDGPIRYANSNNNATIEYSKKSYKKIVEETTTDVEENTTPVIEEKVEPKEEVVEVIEVVEKPVKISSKKNLQFEAKLEKLQKELVEAEKELKKISKEYLPLLRIKKAYERDTNKLAKKEMQVAKQKISLYGVKNTKISQEKAEKLKNDMAIIEDLRDSISSCETVLKQNENRLPDLEKNYMLINKHVSLLKEDIEHIKEIINED